MARTSAAVPRTALRLLVALTAIAAITVSYAGWLRILNPAIVSTTYLMVVLVVAASSRLWIAVVTSVAAMLCLNFFFLPPVGTLVIHDPQNWVTMFAFLAVSLLGSNLSAVARARTEQALVRAQLLEERKKVELTRQSEELKTALLASLGHDLRTPLTAIRVAASNLKASWLSERDRAEQADLVLAEVERLTRLFENVLAMARIDAGAVCAESRWTHPSEIVAAAQDQVEHLLQEHTIDVTIEPDEPVRLDPRLTASALGHLLENAAHYAPPGSPIHVSARTAGGQLSISVRDHGPGLTPADESHIFERFYRGHAAKTRTSGSGMGLWIANGFLAAEGARLIAKNHPDGGAEFTIAVPVPAGDTALASASAP